MRTSVAGALVLAVLGMAVLGPAASEVRAARQEQGIVWGTALAANRSVLPNRTVRLRHIRTGQLAGSTTSDTNGHFRFSVPPDTYLVELLNAAGHVIGVTSPFEVLADVTVSVVVVATADRKVPAAGWSGLFGLGPAATAVIAGAVAVGITAVVATRDEASPSR